MTEGAPLALLIEQCLSETEARIQRLGDATVSSMFHSIRAQLLFMREVVADQQTPSIEDANRLTLGVIAVREFEDTDPAYCDLLCDAAFRFRALAQRPERW
ncbi:MAG: immunity protein Tsi6 family protein [Polyangiales bacterium]